MFFRRTLFATLAVAIALQFGCANASADYSIELEDEYGHTLPTFRHAGQRWAMGQFGQRYNLRVTNHTSRRVEAVVTVDGRDVITGRKGDYKHSRGYIIDARDSVLIEGFRTSLSRVAAFRFTDPSDSYSSRMGTPENVGVIGAAFFPEKRRRRPRPSKPIAQPRASAPAEQYSDNLGTGSGGAPSTRASRARKPRRSKRSAPSADYAAPEAEASPSNLGTEYGEGRYSGAFEVRFERRNRRHPAAIVSVRYDDRSGLRARGIRTEPRRRYRAHRRPSPDPFPDSRFAPPPRY